nr:RNA-directed DNA polymerase, eukaryota [Tanacetum cinerariifolium]
MFFKVDYAKGYDLVRWDNLFEVLKEFGFGQIWCNWIRGTLNSAKASILINGSPSKEFSSYRGEWSHENLTGFSMEWINRIKKSLRLLGTRFGISFLKTDPYGTRSSVLSSEAFKLNAPIEISFCRNAWGGLEQHLMADMNSMLGLFQLDGLNTFLLRLIYSLGELDRTVYQRGSTCMFFAIFADGGA